jgi:hypothetical protein
VNTVLLDGIGRGPLTWGLAGRLISKIVMTHAGTHELTVIDFPLAARWPSARPRTISTANLQSQRAPCPSSEVPERLSFLADVSRRIPLP